MPDKDPKQKDYPATRPDRENGQQDHQGMPHSPDEFDVLNPARPQNKPENGKQDDARDS